MLPGFSGHLVSECFLERYLSEQPPAADRTASCRRELVEWRRRCRALGPASSLRALCETGAGGFVSALGLTKPVEIEAHRDVLVATIRGTRAVALVVAGWGARLDPLWRVAVVEARRRGAAWSLLFNGTHARVTSASRLHSRRCAEFDLDLALDDDRTFAALSTLFGVHSFAPTPRDPESLLHELVDASDRHASAVCRSLRDGVLEASAEVLGALVHRSSRPVIDSAFEQALTIVYRILFLLFAEARNLVPLWHPVYRESYSLERLRAAVERSGTTPGLWDALRAVSRLAHGGCRAGDLRVTAFNGRLFAPASAPLAERRNLDDEAAGRALLALATRPAADRTGRERIAYRDLGVEQLGAVYETLLDYTPHIEPGQGPERPSAQPAPSTRGGWIASLRKGPGLRRATGTFYTPQPIARYLVRRTLAPLVRDRSPDQILSLRVLDPAMGSGAFLVGACEYLAQAYESALVGAGGCHSSDLGPRDQIVFRRMIAERCLYGVDLNPMAVQLARLSLWLATLAADRPLSFLDHHLLAGDSLLGTWLARLCHPPAHFRRARLATGLPLFDDTIAGEAFRHVVPVRFSLASDPSETPEQIRAKERALAAINQPDTPLSKWKRIADLWCARWFSSDELTPASAFGALSDAILNGRGSLPAAAARRYLERAQEVAASRRFFHWELEFPEAFFDADGVRLPAAGFDAILGNPPWDMIRADEGPADQRSEARKDAGSVLRFTRDSGVYTSQSDGQANRYHLFVERAVALARPGGRIGLVLPSGLATDHGSAALRRLLFSRCDVDALVGFDNREGVFPIHRDVRFLLITATCGTATVEVGCRLGERDPAVLETDGEEADSRSWFPVRVTPALLRRLSGDDLTLPELRSPTDLVIAERVAALFPPLGDERSWVARFGRELNATDDRSHFRPPGSGLPIVEGKHLDPFRVRLGGARWSISSKDADQHLGARHHRARLAYRDVASATNRVTLIAAVLPAGCVSTHTVFCLRTRMPIRSQYFLSGLLNSLVVNYLARLRVTTHVTTAIVERLPIPGPEEKPLAFREIAGLARLLARGPVPEASARLNALVARLYQLSHAELEHVLSTFPLIAIQDRDAVMREFLKL